MVSRKFSVPFLAATTAVVFMVVLGIVSSVVNADPMQLPDVTTDRGNMLRLIVFDVAQDYVASIGTTPATADEYCQLMLARHVLSRPGNDTWRYLLMYAQARKEFAATPIEVDWNAVTANAVKANLIAIWTPVAYQKFGPEPTQPGS